MLVARALPYGPNHSRATHPYFLDALLGFRTPFYGAAIIRRTIQLGVVFFTTI